MRSEFTLFTSDSVRIEGTHTTYAHAKNDPDPMALGIVMAHGFTGNRKLEDVQKVVNSLREYAGVLSVDLRGHGDSGGEGTMGMDEIHDIDSAVTHARDFGYRKVATIGFSMGGSIVLRQGALASGLAKPDAVVSVSAPGFWFYRGTRVMRVVHRLIESSSGRLALRGKGVRISSTPWPEPPPMSPEQAVEKMGHMPLLIVHGDVDRYFPVEHAHALEAAAERAGNPKVEVLMVKGFGHAESAIELDTLDRIGHWLRKQASPE